MHRLIHGNAPLYLREGISMVQERHSYNTRNSVLSLVLPRVNSSGDKSFSYIAAKFWNQLPIPIRATENPLYFRSLIKKHFMSLVKTEEETSLFSQLIFVLMVGSCVQVCLSQLSLGLVPWLGCLR